MIICQNCGEQVKYPLPVEPMFTLDVAAFLLNVKVSTLYKYLGKYKDKYPPRYQLLVAEGRRRPTPHRMLSAREIKRLRGHFVRG
jgi:hypothetical protein